MTKDLRGLEHLTLRQFKTFVEGCTPEELDEVARECRRYISRTHGQVTEFDVTILGLMLACCSGGSCALFYASMRCSGVAAGIDRIVGSVFAGAGIMLLTASGVFPHYVRHFRLWVLSLRWRMRHSRVVITMESREKTARVEALLGRPVSK